MGILEILKIIKRRVLIKYYGLKNAHKTFLATTGLSNISKDIKLGAYSYIGPNCLIYPKVSIGDYSLLANNVSIIGGDHNYRKCGIPLVFNGRDEIKETKIGKDCWIGAHAIIMTGVEIGDGCIVAAGSVVTKNLDGFCIYGGVPAKKIKNRFENEEDLLEHKKMLNEKSEDIINLNKARMKELRKI